MPQTFLARCADGHCNEIEVSAPSGSGLDIRGSVGHQGRNQPDDVRKIQGALNRVPPHEGGPSTPLLVDGLSGPKTEAAIYRFQTRHFGAAHADARVDPGQRTLQKLREYQALPAPSAYAQSTGAGSSGSGGGGTAPVMVRVYANLPTMMSWIWAAIRQLQNAEEYYIGEFTELRKPALEKSMLLVDRCFHVKVLGATRAVEAMTRIRRIFHNMQMVIGHYSQMTEIGTGYFQPAPSGCNPPGKVNFAYTYPGGWNAIDNTTGLPKMSSPEFSGESLRQDAIYVCESNSRSKSDPDLCDLLIHEMAHFVGPSRKNFFTIADHAYGTDALKLTHIEAIRTASCYAWLAWLARLPSSEWQTNNG